MLDETTAMSHCDLTGVRVLLGLLLVCGVPCCLAAGPLEVAHGYLRSQAEFDRGTAHLFLQNTGAVPLRIESARIAAVGPDTQPDWQTLASAEPPSAEEVDADCLWWLAMPNPVPAGGFCDVAVRLLESPQRRQRLEVACSDGTTIRREFTRVNDGLSLAFVGFSPTLDTAYLYVGNLTSAPVTIRRVWIGSQDVKDRARILWPQVAPDGQTCIVVPLGRRLEPGTPVFVKVAGDAEAAVCAGVVRAFSLFPITWLDGSLPEGLEGEGDDAGEYRPGAVSKEGLRGIENIMRCPAHAHGMPAQAARQFIRLYSRLLRQEPRIPSLLYVCRWEKETSYFDFGELGDLIRVMPLARSASCRPQPLEHYEQWLMALATRAAAPRPVHAEVPIRFADSHSWTRSCTPQEVEALVYLALSRGAKGLSYGERRDGLSKEAQQALRDVTRQVILLRPYLRFAQYMSLGRTDADSVEAATLLAGDRAVVVLVINHDFNDFNETDVLRCRPRQNVTTTVTLAPNLRVRAVQDVRAGERAVEWRQEGTHLRLRTDRVEIVRPYLVLFETQDEGTP
jgi:hypothetical protein